MGYLNNSTRVLDAILTKKGRELLSSGGNFNVTKFALGDDEIDYQLWDTTHTRGTDYYGAVIDNLPALEPFNDPSEIMKYKLVTRSDGTQAMAILQDTGGSATGLAALKWYATVEGNRIAVSNFTSVEVGGGVGGGTTFGVSHVNNRGVVGGHSDYNLYAGESFTITLLDSSVAVLAPSFNTDLDAIQTTGTNAWAGRDYLWVPFVDNVQHISQTISGITLDGTQFIFDNERLLYLYPKQIKSASSPVKTSILVTGDQSGAMIEFDVTITYAAS